MDEIRRIQAWYASHCDGVWEHDHGVTITTLDNPGWHVLVDLVGTSLENCPFAELHREGQANGEWIRVRKVSGRIEGACGPTSLAVVLAEFLRWAESAVSKGEGEQDDHM
jgi:hypothetical protein